MLFHFHLSFNLNVFFSFLERKTLLQQCTHVLHAQPPVLPQVKEERRWTSSVMLYVQQWRLSTHKSQFHGYKYYLCFINCKKYSKALLLPSPNDIRLHFTHDVHQALIFLLWDAFIYTQVLFMYSDITREKNYTRTRNRSTEGPRVTRWASIHSSPTQISLIVCLLHLCVCMVSEPTQWQQQCERRGSPEVSSLPRQCEWAVWTLPRHLRFWPSAHGGWKISEGQWEDSNSDASLTVSFYIISHYVI